MAGEFNIKNGFISNNNSRVIGALSATSFIGDGAGLINVPAGAWSGGNVTSTAYFLAGLSATTISATTYYGDGSNLTGITASWAGGNVSNPSSFSAGLTANTLSVTSDSIFQNVTASTLTITGNTNLKVVTATTISGVTTLRSGTISATTYNNLPTDVFVTGGTYSASVSTIVFRNSTGGTFNVTGITATGGGTAFTGGTVTGATSFTAGLTSNTLTITSFPSNPISSSIGVDQFGNIVTGQTASNFTGGTVTGATLYTGGLSANTISATTYQNLPVSGLTAGSNITITPNGVGNFTISQGSGSAVNITGGTYNPTTNILTFSANTGPIPVTGITVYTQRQTDYQYPFQYSGSAPFGTSENTALWIIRRIAFSSATPTITQAVNVAWSGRTLATYNQLT